MRRCLPLLLAVLLGACAENPPAEPPPPPVAAPAPEPPFQPLKYLAGRTFDPQPTQVLNVRSKCAHRDALGTRTRLNLQVKNAEVKAFNAEIAIPKRGICRFNLKDFTQTEKLPQVILSAKDGSPCTVRLWEQNTKQRRQVTVAFNTCPAACGGDTFDYLWPILVDAKSGRCF